MSYEIFARKYRPWKFDEVVGQLSVVRTIQNAIASNRIAQAYLFSGVRGTGKTTVARILAKALNCATGPTANPCVDMEHACPYCKSIHEGSAIDVLEIDGASNRQVDDVDSIREMVKYKPVYTRTKILIIDEVHMLTTHAFNALLKTLEEPPPNTVFIFATTEFNKVPATIVSRCQHFEFRKISHKDIINHLMEITKKEGITITPSGLAMIAEAADGSMRDAQSLLDQAVAFSGENVGDEDLKTILGTIGTDVLFRFSGAVLDEKTGGHLRPGRKRRRLGLRSSLRLRQAHRALPGPSPRPDGRETRRSPAPEPRRPPGAPGRSGQGLAGRPSSLPARPPAGRVRAEVLGHAADLLSRRSSSSSAISGRSSPSGSSSGRWKRSGRTARPRGPRARPAGPPSAAGHPAGGSAKPGPSGAVSRPDPPVPAGPAARRRPPPPKPAAPAQKDVFVRVLERLAVDRAPLAALLGQYSSVLVKDNVLEVLFGSGRGFFVTSIQDKDLRAVERAASEVLGRETKVRFAEEGEAAGGPIRPGRELESAMKDPAVKFFMDKFKAQVLSADPIQSSRDAGPKGRGPTENGT